MLSEGILISNRHPSDLSCLYHILNTKCFSNISDKFRIIFSWLISDPDDTLESDVRARVIELVRRAGYHLGVETVANYLYYCI